MIFKNLELVNFGIYKGSHRLELSPKKGKPIILIGGLNGRGKTTLIDAFQLVLFGKFAKCSNRKGLSYDDFLLDSINRDVDPKDGARLKLTLQLRKDRELVEYEVTRTWNSVNGKVGENVDVSINGLHDPMLSSSWEQFIQQTIPMEISEFLFFDGEKIEQLAQAGESKQLVKVGIRALLGINLVSTLVDDLNYLPRRFNKKKTPIANDKEEKLQRLIDELESKREVQTELLAVKQNNLDQLEKEEVKLHKKFEDLGGDIYMNRAEIESQRKQKQLSASQLALEQIKHAEGISPLNLIRPLIENLVKSASQAKIAAEVNTSITNYIGRDIELLSALKQDKFTKKDIVRISNIQKELLPDPIEGNFEMFNKLDLDELVSFDCNLLTSEQEEIRRTSIKLSQLNNEIEARDKQMAALPQEEEVSSLNKLLTSIEKEKAKACMEIEVLYAEREKLQMRLSVEQDRMVELSKMAAKERAESDLEVSMLEHIPKLVETLKAFKERTAQKSVHKLEIRILECFHQLVGKADLISTVRISPTDFSVALEDKSGKLIPSARLSAGERQLLAIAFIWGLSSSANIPLPTVIDTPLGRLDSIHKNILLTRYFPSAAGQVLLLSTDEEVDAAAYYKIKKHISREYSVIYDAKESSSKILEGYHQLLENKAA